MNATFITPTTGWKRAVPTASIATTTTKTPLQPLPPCWSSSTDALNSTRRMTTAVMNGNGTAFHNVITSTPIVQQVASPTPLPAVMQPSAPPEVGGSGNVTVVWYRDDLRVHDHPALCSAVRGGHTIAALLIAPSDIGSSSGVSGAFATERAAAFWRESVADLRASLRALGGELYIRRTTGEVNTIAETVANFCAECRASRLHFHRAAEATGVGLEKAVCVRLQRDAVECIPFWTGVLRTPDELPGGVQGVPEDCDEFSRLVASIDVAEPLPVPKDASFVSGLQNAGDLPGAAVVNKGNSGGGGGENAGLRRVRDYVAGRTLASVDAAKGVVDRAGTARKVATATTTAMTSVGVIDTKFGRLAPFLTVGCVSPRRLWHDVMQNVSERSLRRFCAEFDLVLRDFTTMMTLKHGVHPA